MTAMIVHAHPVPDSLNRALVAAAIDGLSGADAALASSSPISASLYDGDDPTAADLCVVETLVFVYPTWWGGPPALLLDWIERRLGPWIDGAPSDPSPLSSVRRLAAVTTHGSPRLSESGDGRTRSPSLRDVGAIAVCTRVPLEVAGVLRHRRRRRCQPGRLRGPGPRRPPRLHPLTPIHPPVTSDGRSVRLGRTRTRRRSHGSRESFVGNVMRSWSGTSA